jgi:hypothetical protein
MEKEYWPIEPSLVEGFKVLTTLDFCRGRFIDMPTVVARLGAVETAGWEAQFIDANNGIRSNPVNFDTGPQALHTVVQSFLSEDVEPLGILELTVSEELDFMGAALLLFLLYREGEGVLFTGVAPRGTVH